MGKAKKARKHSKQGKESHEDEVLKQQKAIADSPQLLQGVRHSPFFFATHRSNLISSHS